MVKGRLLPGKRVRVVVVDFAAVAALAAAVPVVWRDQSSVSRPGWGAQTRQEVVRVEPCVKAGLLLLYLNRVSSLDQFQVLVEVAWFPSW